MLGTRRRQASTSGNNSNAANLNGSPYKAGSGLQNYPSKMSSPPSDAKGKGVKLSLDDDLEEDEDNGFYSGISRRNASSPSLASYAFGSNGGSNGVTSGTSNGVNGVHGASAHAGSSTADIPLVGSGSRAKILSQLGQVEKPVLESGPSNEGRGFRASSMSSRPSIGQFSSSSGSSSAVSPLTQVPHTSPSRERQKLGFRKHSAGKLSFSGLSGMINASPVSTPSHISSGVLPQDQTNYFSFPTSSTSPPSSSPQPNNVPPLSFGSSLAGSRSSSSLQTALQTYGGSLNANGSSSTPKRSPMKMNLSSYQRSAPSSVQTFKIGLPPVEQSPRQTLASPVLGTSASSPNIAATERTLHTDDGRPDISVHSTFGGRQSFSDLDRNMRVDRAAPRWPSLANGKSTDPDLADDGQLEEIVPWLYQSKDGLSSPTSPLSQPRMRQHSASQTLAGNSASLRVSKSTNNLKSGRHDSTGSIESPPGSRDRKPSGRFMGMLRKKSSAIAVNIQDVLSPNRDRSDVSPRGSLSATNNAKVPSRPKLAPRAAGQSSEDGKSAKKAKKQKRGDSTTLPSVVGGTGYALDTNLDEMEGIVNLNQPYQPFPRPGDVAYQSNGQIPGLSTSPAPGTPPSPSQMNGYRRPSLASSAREFMTGEANDFSPIGKRLGISRRDSMDIVASMNNWTQNGGFTGAGIPHPPPSANAYDPSRKGSLSSLMVNDRRASDATGNNVGAVNDSSWIAPDSWDVKPLSSARDDDDESEDDERAAAASDRVKSDGASTLTTPMLAGETPGVELAGLNIPNVVSSRATHKLTGTRQPALNGTIGMYGKSGNVPMGAIRIFKPDNAHTILNVPYSTSAAELLSMISKKPGFITAKTQAQSYKLFCRARGLERIMMQSERPLLWQERKFLQAGYDKDSDRLEELGREDNSYLVKFIFKPEPSISFRAEEEGQEGFEYIDLSARQIDNLPIFLYKHAHEIISLNLSRNSRLQIPSDFVQACTSLRDLKMVEMGIKRIQPSVRQIAGLTRLDLSINRIVDLEHAMLNELPELTTLFIHNNRLTALPDYFVHFSCLKYLNISNNRFETFPVVVCDVASLVDLDVSFNNLSVLPPEIGKLKNLQTLTLFSNNITVLPATLSSMTKLRELDVRYNLIEDFSPVNLAPKLASVRAQYNAAKSLELFAGTLSVLNLSHNALTRFTIVGGSTAALLTHLDLSHARLETVPEDLFVLCTSLQLLVLSDNKIRNISDQLGNLQKLTRLHLNNNALLSIPASIGSLQRLHTLDVSNNKLSSIPASIWLCSELTLLNLSSNGIVEVPDPPEVPTDEDSDRKMSAGTSTRAAPPLAMSLKKLYLAYNRFRDDVFRPISLMTGLILLNLSFNDIYEIPPGMLRHCYQLTHLHLSGNMLTSLPADDLERLSSLRLLHLNGNKLQTLPAELAKLKALQTLDVGTNALKYNIANWPYDWNWNWNLELRYLNLSGNKRLEIRPSAQSAHEMSPTGSSVKRRNLSDFSALSKIRILGLMDVTLMIPSVPDESENRRVRTSLSSINEMGYGVADCLGTRDHLAIIDLIVPKFRGKDDECVIGLFDAGTSDAETGAKIAKFITDQFVQRLTLELSRLRDEDASQGLRRSFLTLQRDWGNSVMPAYDRGRKESDFLGQGERFQNAAGSASDVKAAASAAVIYIYKKTLYVANVGDSMAIIVGRTMLARVLTTKHEPCSRDEVTRIRSSEGWVSIRGLVNDLVEHSRNFGCFHVYPAVNTDPAVHVLDLVDDDEFVIVANGGLWQYLSYQAAIDVAWEHRGDPMLAAQKLRDIAIAYGCESNVLVMVINVGDLFKGKHMRLNRSLTTPATSNDAFYDNKYVGRRVPGSIPGLRVAADQTIAPTGTVALVFTDIRNSTALWETNPGMQNAMRIHHELMRRLIRAYDGYEVKTEGDAFMVSFTSITSAALFCFMVQLRLLEADWPAELLMSDEGKEIYGPYGETIYKGLSVRMGLHWGTPICEQDPVNLRMDYLGPVVNRAARVSGVAEGGQITASADAVELLRALLSATSDNEHELDQPLVDPNELDPATKRDIVALRQTGFCVTELGEKKLKGLETPEFLSVIYPTALTGRISGGKIREAIVPQDASSATPHLAIGPVTQPAPALLETNDIRNLGNICLRLEALSAGNDHRLYETSSAYPNSGTNSPAIGAITSTAAPRRRVTLSSHLLVANQIRNDATDEQLVVLLELLIVRIENVLSSLQLRQLGPLTNVLSALSDAIKVDPQQIMQALSMLAQLL